MRLLLLRHAESTGNAAGVIQGRVDHPLSARGAWQAEKLAQRFAGPEPLDQLYASPLVRADCTAGAIARLTGLPIAPLPAAMEYDFGVASGMTFAEARRRYSASPNEFPTYPEEEGRALFSERVLSAFMALEAAHPDSVVAVTTHGGPIAAFLMGILGLHYRRPLPFRIDNASISTVDLRGGRGTVFGINDTCHLND